MFSAALNLLRSTTAAHHQQHLFAQILLPLTGLPKLTLAPGKTNKRRHCSQTPKRTRSNQKAASKKSQSNNMERGWEYSEISHADVADSGEELTVMSYNILAQHLLNIHGELYLNHTRRFLAWDHRLNRIIKHIEAVQPKVLCLQEVQTNHLSEIIKRLARLGLDQHIYKKRTSDDYMDGCAIFYRSDMLELVDSHRVEYFQPEISLLDRPNVAVLAKFRSYENPDIVFCAATTHLLYNPKREDVRLAQIQVLLAELDRFSYIGKSVSTGKIVRAPIIISGDFNAQPCTATIELMATGQVCYQEREGRKLHDKQFSDSPTYGKCLLPTSVGITDSCQHINFAKYNLTDSTYLYNSSNNPTDSGEASGNFDISGMPFETGTLRHHLSLASVYDNDFTATTYHEQWITVDYIFFSKRYDSARNRLVDDSLRLLARHRLPTVEHCSKMGPIPNETEGSDHISQAAKFLVLPTVEEVE